MPKQLSDKDVLSRADAVVNTGLRGQGTLTRDSDGTASVVYNHPGPGGRNRSTVVHFDASGAITNTFTN